MKINTELGELAAEGDETALIEIHDFLLAQGIETRRNAAQILSALRGSVQMSDEVYRKLLKVSQKFVQLGDQDLAEALRMAVHTKSNQASSQGEATLKIYSDRERRYELLHLDSYLRLPSLARASYSGFLPNELHLDMNVSYLLSVETVLDEPKLTIPICIRSDSLSPKSVNINLEAWRGLGQDFALIPEFSCAIGGDLAARDPLPDMTVHTGPIAVSLKHVRMKDYLTLLKEQGVTSMESRYFPMFMGKPLVEFDQGTWKMLDITVKDGHIWLDVPAVGVDFDCATWYCSNYDLPEHLVGDLMTEYEWEAIARGPDGRLFPWGDIYIPGFSNIVVTDKSSREGLEAVGYRKTDISAFGLFDCSGNAEEWCRFGSPDSQEDQSGFALARGGSWYNPVQPSRLASRVVRHRDYRHKKLTFRVVARLKDSST
jgi:hypothetical protein